MPKRISLSVEGASGRREELLFTVESICCAGYTSRDKVSAMKHIDELRKLGVKVPDHIPTFYRLAPYILVTDSEQSFVEVKGRETSGEVEWVGLLSDQLYVTVGSDHTDRWLERLSVGLSKQVCQKMISSTAWRYSDLADHWDSLKLRSWAITKEGERSYQQGRLGDILSSEELTSGSGAQKGTVLFSGTFPTNDGKLVYADGYRMRLEDPVLQRRIELRYDVSPLPEE